MGDLSLHFSKVELACHCCGDLKIEKALIDALELLRSLAGKEIIVHDGYRCPPHNQKVGGVPDSEHTLGMAADINIPGMALRVPTFLNGGIGAYDGGFLHVDTRPHQARWARVRGQYVGIQHLVSTPQSLLAKVQTEGNRA